MDDLPAGQLKLVEAGGTRVVLARVRDEVFACSDECAHQGGPLSEGRLSGARLACPWHGWMYDVRSGECVMPARGARRQLSRDGRGRRDLGGGPLRWRSHGTGPASASNGVSSRRGRLDSTSPSRSSTTPVTWSSATGWTAPSG